MMISKSFKNLQLLNKTRAYFGLIDQYNRRKNIKMSGTHLVDQKSRFFVSPARPGNFQNHVDVKITLDNWFQQNRYHNQHQPQYKKTQMYALTAISLGGLLSFAQLYAFGIVTRLNGMTRYYKDTYMQYDISQLPPGQVIQLVWNGTPIFIRRLTPEQIKHEQSLPTNTILDKESQVILNDAGVNKILVCSAVCTHLGCIPIPYLGSYKGWVCICHGSVYDKLGRVRQGPAMKNLPYINNSVYEQGSLVCMQQIKYPTLPQNPFWT